MKIVFLSSYANPATGASALCRLAGDLRARGHEATIVTTDPDAPALAYVKKITPTLGARIAERFIKVFVDPFMPGAYHANAGVLGRTIDSLEPDVVNVHWVHGHTIPLSLIRDLAKTYPLFWTFHDMWPISGGEKYAPDDGGWLDGYKDAPATPEAGHSLRKTRRAWQTKYRMLHSAQIDIVCPSLWLAGLARQSPIFTGRPVSHIPYGIDMKTFAPLDLKIRQKTREKLGVKDGHIALLFIAGRIDEPRKGYMHLKKALEEVSASHRERLVVILVGTETRPLPALPVRTIKAGSVTTAADLAAYYGTADIFVLPTEADNLPSTAIESIACGLPVAAFDVGGVSDMVREDETGLLAPAGDTQALAAAIGRLADDQELRTRLSRQAAAYAREHFSAELQTEAYLKLFRSAADIRTGNR